MTQGAVHLGTQGWAYPGWVGSFYPAGTRPPDMLGVYARAFRTVEVDTTFYGLPASAVVREWAARVPADFRFALKVPQEITHSRQLVDGDDLLGRFLDRARLLGDRLGPLLIQLSPAFRADDDNRRILADFLAKLPAGFRWAVEFRDPRWIVPRTAELLRTRKVALTLADGRWIRRRTMLDLASQPTADFAYVRWMGSGRRVVDYPRLQTDRERELTMWAVAIDHLRARVRDVFGFFNNHFQGHSPGSVRRLQELVGEEAVGPSQVRDQGDLF